MTQSLPENNICLLNYVQMNLLYYELTASVSVCVFYLIFTTILEDRYHAHLLFPSLAFTFIFF